MSTCTAEANLLEMDMDTHQKPRFQKKIASYVAFINEGLYEQHFQTTSVVIAFAAAIFVVVAREWYLRRRGRIH